MSSSGFQLANLLAELTGGRNPQWEAQAQYTGAPAIPSAGVALQDAVITMVAVGARAELHRRSAYVTMSGTIDPVATYTVTIEGTGVSMAAPANEDALIIGLRNAILADATVGGGAGDDQIVTAQALDSDGDVTLGTVAGGNAAKTLEVLGTVEDDYDIDVSAGTGALACVADAKTGTVRFFMYPKTDTLRSSATTAPERWGLVPNSETSITWRGIGEGEGRTNGAARLYVEVADLAGAGDGASVTHRLGGGVHVGPCVRETS